MLKSVLSLSGGITRKSTFSGVIAPSPGKTECLLVVDKTYCESNQKGYLGAASEVSISSSFQLPGFPAACGKLVGSGGAGPYSLQLFTKRKIKRETEISMYFLRRLRKQLYFGMCAERRALLLAVCTTLWWTVFLFASLVKPSILPSWQHRRVKSLSRSWWLGTESQFWG